MISRRIPQEIFKRNPSQTLSGIEVSDDGFTPFNKAEPLYWLYTAK